MGTASSVNSIDKTAEAARLTLAELERAIAEVDPGALVLPSRIVRRVIREEHRLPRLRPNLPHGLSYTIVRERLLEIVDHAELTSEAAASLSDRVILLSQPDPEELEFTPAAELLARYWRWLFHSHVHLSLEQRIADGTYGPAVLERWLCQLGMTEFAEARLVLTQEGRLFADADDWAVLVELVATYLELRWFAPSTLEHYFPGFHDRPDVEALFTELIDAGRLAAETRLGGAKLADVQLPPVDDDSNSIFANLVETQVTQQSRQPSARIYRYLVARAEGAAWRGNLVRACILLQRARKYAAEKDAHRVRASLRGHLVRLVLALQEALQLPDTEIDAWREAMSALVTRAAVGIFSREARLLFDLQKITVDRRRQVFRIDTLGWLRSLGTTPLRRPLPQLTEVSIHRHLLSALGRTKAVRIADAQRQTLQTLLERAEERNEQQMRLRLRPIIARALEDARLLPTNTVERIAARKLVEELIDRILDRGFLAMGDLRDAVARNNLKAPDLSGPKDLISGDQLLSADREMAAALDGVYRRGEVYLRSMQRLSSLAFGTHTGRLLTRYLILPFGGAYIVVEGVKHLVATVEHLVGMETSEALVGEHLSVVFALGCFLLLLINAQRFRSGLWYVLRAVGHGVHYLTRELPQKFMQLEIVRRVLQSPYYRWVMRGIVAPLGVTGLLALFMPYLVPRWHSTPISTGLTFLAASLLLNSRVGRDLEELLTDGIGRLWHWLSVQVIARLFWLTMDLFRAAVEATERLLYSVDEWLRFRSGEGRFTLAIKAVLLPFWALIAYVTRFCVNLLIEPQINPIKHFPVVTVSHKVMLPFIPVLASVFMLAMDRELAYTSATVIIFAIPGIFGFLAWELRENWRLYAANRPQSLQPVVVGKHAESMRRLLLPGFHSGTIPKRYAKLRHAEQEASGTGRWHPVRKHLGVLEDVEVRVRRFLERDLLWLLNEASCWNGSRIYLARVQLSANRVRAELRLDESSGAMLLEFEARSGWLLGSMSGTEVVEQLSAEQRDALTTAVTGLYKAAGIDLVCQEIEAQLPLPTPLYDLRQNELLIWPEGEPATVVRYNLDGEPPALLDPTDGTISSGTLPRLDIPRLLFRQISLSWDSWVKAWETLASGRDQRLGIGDSRWGIGRQDWRVGAMDRAPNR